MYKICLHIGESLLAPAVNALKLFLLFFGQILLLVFRIAGVLQILMLLLVLGLFEIVIVAHFANLKINRAKMNTIRKDFGTYNVGTTLVAIKLSSDFFLLAAIIAGDLHLFVIIHRRLESRFRSSSALRISVIRWPQCIVI